jgi:hypothetical protein
MAATKPRVRDDVTVCDIEGEAVVYDPNGGGFHYLNHSAALVLDLCDGTATMREMAGAIADVYEMPADDIEKTVREVVADLREQKLLVPSKRPPAEEAPAAEHADPAADERPVIRMQVPRTA